MFAMLIITAFALSSVFGIILWHISEPWGGHKQVVHFFQGISLKYSRTLRIVKMIQRRGVKRTHKKYPKTMDWLISSLTLFILSIIALVALIYASAKK